MWCFLGLAAISVSCMHSIECALIVLRSKLAGASAKHPTVAVTSPCERSELLLHTDNLATLIIRFQHK